MQSLRFIPEEGLIPALFVVDIRNRLQMVVEPNRRATAAASEIQRSLSLPDHGGGFASAAQKAFSGNLTVIIDCKRLGLAAGKQDQLAIGVLKSLTPVRFEVDGHPDKVAVTVEPYAFRPVKPFRKADFTQSVLLAP